MNRVQGMLVWLVMLPYVLTAHGGPGLVAFCIRGDRSTAVEWMATGSAADRQGRSETRCSGFQVDIHRSSDGAACPCCLDASVPGLPGAAPLQAHISSGNPAFSPVILARTPDGAALRQSGMDLCPAVPIDWLNHVLASLRAIVLQV
jgi:hypothetical protein